MTKRGRPKGKNTERIDITLPIPILKAIDNLKKQKFGKSSSHVISKILVGDLTINNPEAFKQFLIFCERVETIQKATDDIKKSSWLGRGKHVRLEKESFEKLVRKVIRRIK